MHVKNQTEQKGEIDHATFLQTFLLIFYHNMTWPKYWKSLKK